MRPGRAVVATLRDLAITALNPSSRTEVPLKAVGGTFVVPVAINGAITLNFIVDSGAADVTVPSDVVGTLIRTGTIERSDFIGTQTYVLADGSELPSSTFMIRSLKVQIKIAATGNKNARTISNAGYWRSKPSISKYFLVHYHYGENRVSVAGYAANASQKANLHYTIAESNKKEGDNIVLVSVDLAQ